MVITVISAVLTWLQWQSAHNYFVNMLVFDLVSVIVMYDNMESGLYMYIYKFDGK